MEPIETMTWLLTSASQTISNVEKKWFATAIKASLGHRCSQLMVQPLMRPGNFNALLLNFSPTLKNLDKIAFNGLRGCLLDLNRIFLERYFTNNRKNNPYIRTQKSTSQYISTTQSVCTVACTADGKVLRIHFLIIVFQLQVNTANKQHIQNYL